jgi:hypothetical protein
MQTRKLGKGNLEVLVLGLGCMGMSFSYGPPKDKQEMIKLLHAAVDRGEIGQKMSSELWGLTAVSPHAREQVPVRLQRHGRWHGVIDVVDIAAPG